MDMSLSKLWEIVKDREAWHAQFIGLQRVRQGLVAEQQHSIKNPAMAYYKLPIWSHWLQGQEERWMVGSYKEVEASSPYHSPHQFSSVQSLSRVRLFATPWITAHQASLSITNSQSWWWLKLMSVELVMPSSHFILCHPLLLLPLIPPSIRVFSNESTLLMRWPKYWSFSFSISPSNEQPGLISFRMDWLDLLVVQGTLKSLPQHHSSKASIFRCLAFFTVQLSHPYMTTGKP